MLEVQNIKKDIEKKLPPNNDKDPHQDFFYKLLKNGNLISLPILFLWLLLIKKSIPPDPLKTFTDVILIGWSIVAVARKTDFGSFLYNLLVDVFNRYFASPIKEKLYPEMEPHEVAQRLIKGNFSLDINCHENNHNKIRKFERKKPHRIVICERQKCRFPLKKVKLSLFLSSIMPKSTREIYLSPYEAVMKDRGLKKTARPENWNSLGIGLVIDKKEFDRF